MASKLSAMPPNYHGWWHNAKTEKITLAPKKPCSHEFKLIDTGAQCMKCNLGFLGEGFEIRDGKLYNNNVSEH